MNLFWDVGETEKELLESFVVKVRAWRVLLLGRDSKLDRKCRDMTPETMFDYAHFKSANFSEMIINSLTVWWCTAPLS